MQTLNLSLFNRVLTTPWAMRHETLTAFLQALLTGTSVAAPGRAWGKGAPALQPKADTTFDSYYWDDETQQVVRGKLPTKEGYTVCNWEGFSGSMRGTLPDLRPGTHCILVWGPLGRAWSTGERWWCDGIEVDEIISAITARPPGEKIVLWFRSPGGFVTGVPETGAQLRALAAQREIVAFTDDLCASAAYWMASQCRRIVATPTAAVGSIGVYLALYDFVEMLAKAGVKLELFKAGTLKAIGLLGNPLDDAARAHLQAGVDEAYAQFTRAVTEMRTIAPEHMQGQTLNGSAARAANLVDAFTPSAATFLA